MEVIRVEDVITAFGVVKNDRTCMFNCEAGTWSKFCPPNPDDICKLCEKIFVGRTLDMMYDIGSVVYVNERVSCAISHEFSELECYYGDSCELGKVFRRMAKCAPDISNVLVESTVSKHLDAIYTGVVPTDSGSAPLQGKDYRHSTIVNRLIECRVVYKMWHRLYITSLARRLFQSATVEVDGVKIPFWKHMSTSNLPPMRDRATITKWLAAQPLASLAVSVGTPTS